MNDRIRHSIRSGSGIALGYMLLSATNSFGDFKCNITYQDLGNGPAPVGVKCNRYSGMGYLPWGYVPLSAQITVKWKGKPQSPVILHNSKCSLQQLQSPKLCKPLQNWIIAHTNPKLDWQTIEKAVEREEDDEYAVTLGSFTMRDTDLVYKSPGTMSTTLKDLPHFPSANINSSSGPKQAVGNKVKNLKPGFSDDPKSNKSDKSDRPD